MGQKDISEKILEEYNDVFADIVNVLLFDGEEIINPDELEEQNVRSAYKADGKLREIERDVAKRWNKENIRLACVGIENQTRSDADMPLRVIGYDGAEYRAQLNRDSRERYPVVTMVLYFGYEKHWDQPVSLFERLNISDYLKPFVNDYRINLFEVAFLDDGKLKLFKSDFKIVADYFIQMRKNGDYIPNREQLKHVKETLGLLSVMTDDKRFEEILISDKREVTNMCEFLDRVENKGFEKGLEQGIKKGVEQGIKKGVEQGIESMAINLYRQGITPDIIAKSAGVTVSIVEQWLGLAHV